MQLQRDNLELMNKLAVEHERSERLNQSLLHIHDSNIIQEQLRSSDVQVIPKENMLDSKDDNLLICDT